MGDWYGDIYERDGLGLPSFEMRAITVTKTPEQSRAFKLAFDSILDECERLGRLSRARRFKGGRTWP